MKYSHFTRSCLIFLGLALSLPPGLAQERPLQTVKSVDLKLYSGTWYEIASIPMSFQNPECVGTTATYTLNPDGSIKVWNQCYIPDPKGYYLEKVEGRAIVADKQSNAKLKVSFGGPFEGDYWIIALDPAYSYALVGHPSRNYLWVLSRQPTMEKATYETLLAAARAQGYDTRRLQRTPRREEGLRL